jgi:hypothetical protein
MTIAQWLASRTPAPPPDLLDRLTECVGPAAGASADSLPEHAIDTAERMLRQLLAAGDTGRATALDLLVVDALVTYAFEAASDHPETLVPRAQLAMQRLAALSQQA